MQWRHSAAWTAWCAASDTDTVEGFQFIRVSYFYNYYVIRNLSLVKGPGWPAG